MNESKVIEATTRREMRKLVPARWIITGTASAGAFLLFHLRSGLVFAVERVTRAAAWSDGRITIDALLADACRTSRVLDGAEDLSCISGRGRDVYVTIDLADVAAVVSMAGRPRW